MEQDLFKLLPSEIIIDILSRLPVRAIVTSKCVSKPWLGLLSSDAFVSSHLSKSVPALVMVGVEDEFERMCCKVFEFVDEVDDIVVERRSDPFIKFKFVDRYHNDKDVERRYNQLTKIDCHDVFEESAEIMGAVDGLLALRSVKVPFNVHICNPFTREIVELSRPCWCSNWGFGASKITGHHKVVHICLNPEAKCCGRYMCQVYTLETGSWKFFEVPGEFRYLTGLFPGVFFNGNLHWLGGTEIGNGSRWLGSGSIICFDLETECFSMFSAPPHLESADGPSICVFEDYLCVRVSVPLSSEDYEFGYDIWLLKEDGVERSWTKEYVIGMHDDDHNAHQRHSFYPRKLFKDGDMLCSTSSTFSLNELFDLCHYSNKTLTACQLNLPLLPASYPNVWLLTPSLLSLERNLGMENVSHFRYFDSESEVEI